VFGLLLTPVFYVVQRFLTNRNARGKVAQREKKAHKREA
jgi:hypothetical protein